MQDANADQHLLDRLAEASAAEGIQQGLQDQKAGRTRSARTVFDGLRAAYCLAR